MMEPSGTKQSSKGTVGESGHTASTGVLSLRMKPVYGLHCAAGTQYVPALHDPDRIGIAIPGIIPGMDVDCGLEGPTGLMGLLKGRPCDPGCPAEGKWEGATAPAWLMLEG